MRYSRTAITELTSKYRSILRKCAFLNAAILMGAMIANPANAWDHEYTTRQVNNTNDFTYDDDYFHSSNQTGERGGAIYNTSGNTLNLLRDSFSANSADWGGAIYSGGNAPLYIYGGTSFSNNIARYEGGAIYSAANVSIYGHDGGIRDYSTGVVFNNNTANEYPNDIYMGGSANTHLYLNLASQVHTYPCGDDICDGYRYYKDDITLGGGVDGEHYTINATSQTNSAGTSTVAMGKVTGATAVNIGGLSTFGKATADKIEADNLNMYNDSSLVVSGYVDLNDSVNVSDESSLTVGDDLYAENNVNNHGVIFVGDENNKSDLWSTNLNNTNGYINVAGDIYAYNDDVSGGGLINLRENGVGATSSTIIAGKDIEAYSLSNTKAGTSTGIADVSAGGDIVVATDLTNTNGSVSADGDIEVLETLSNSLTSNTDDVYSLVSADYDIKAATITNTKTGSGNGTAAVTASGEIYATKTVGEETTTYTGTQITNSNAAVTAGTNIYATTIGNTKGLVKAEDGNIIASGAVTNTATDAVSVIQAGGKIEAASIENTGNIIGDDTFFATITAGSSGKRGDIDVETTLENTNGTITAHGSIAVATSITNTNGTISTESYPEEPEEPLPNSISTIDLTNTNGTISALGRISAVKSDYSDGSITNSGVGASISSGKTIDTVSLTNTNGSISATDDIYANDDDSTSGGLINLREDGVGVASAVVSAGGDIGAYILSNEKEGTADGAATVTAGGDIYATKNVDEETTTYTGLTLNNTLGSVSATGNIYAIGGANSGSISANTLYLQGDTTTPRTYGNTGLIDAVVDITAGMTLTTDGIDNVTTPTKGIAKAINNEGLLKVTSGKIVADVTGAGTLQVDAGNTAEINSGVTVSQNTVATAAEIEDPATDAAVLTNNGTLNVNTLLDNKGEIANAGTINLNGIALQTNAGVISGNGTLNVKTIAGTETVPDKTTKLTNNGLINNNVAVDAGSTFVTAASDNAVAASATSGITGAIANNGALVFNNTGYLLDNITGDNGTTTIGANIDAATGVGITQKDISIVAETGLLAIDADKIVGTVTNDNVLVLRGGAAADSAKALTQAINGEGTTAIDDGYVTSDYAINQEALIFGDASLSINANNIGDHVINAGALNLTGGKLSQNVNYESETQTGSKAGTVTIAGNTEFAADAIYADTVNINAGSTLTVGDRIINTNTGNIDGTLDLHITAAAKDAETVAGSNVTISDLNIDGNAKLVVNVADGVLDTQHAKTHSVALIKGADAVFTADQIQIVSDGNYTIEVDDVNKKYVLINEDSYADTSAATGGSTNNQNVANAIDNAMGLEDGSAGREVQKKLNLVSKSDPIVYKKALTDMAPTDTAVHTGITQDFNNLLDVQLSDRLAEGRNGGDVFENHGAWVQALYNHSEQDSSHGSPGFKGHTVGFALGLDGQLNNETTVGIGYAYGKSDVDSAGRDTDVESHNIFAYAKYQPSKWSVRGMVNYGTSKYDEKANILGVVNKGKYDVQNYGVRAYVGYDLDYGFTPEAGLRYTYIKQDSYTDTLGQHVRADDVDVLTAVLGANYSMTLKAKDITWSPKAHLSFTYDLSSDDANATVNIGSSVYDIKGKRLERFGMETGAGVEASIGNWDFTAEYDLGVRKDYTSHTGMLKAKYNF